jgi:hypothetical protein
VGLGWDELVDDAPYVYQVIDGRQVGVAGQFELVDSHTYTFAVTGAYDHGRELVIDPDLAWSTYLGGSGEDRGMGVAMGGAGDAFLTGYTESADFPTPGGFDQSFDGAKDAFVAKVTSAGELAWVSYLGGSGGDGGAGIAVDAMGNALVTGSTYSANFPTPGGFNTSFNGAEDGFVAKVTSAGDLIWASYLGGSHIDWGRAIAVDGVGNVMVTGYTSSIDFPTPGGFDTSFGGGQSDAFVAKVTSAGELAWASYLGRGYYDSGLGIAVDAAGNALVTGVADWVGAAGFPATADAFVAKVTSSGQLAWISYLGGRGFDAGEGIAVDAAGNALVTGYTQSGFPAQGGFDSSYNGGYGDAFIVKMTSSGQLTWASYLGGRGVEDGFAVAVDAAGNAIVTGWTDSPDFPALAGFDTSFNGGSGPYKCDVFMAKVTSAGQLAWGSYLGGSGSEWGMGIAVDAAGSALVTGWTDSTDFPTPGGFDSSFNGGPEDAFVAKIRGAGDPCGDADHDGDVDILDVAVLQTKYGTTSGATWADGDFDGNGTVDIFDVALMQRNYGLAVVSPPAPAPEPAAMPATSAEKSLALSAAMRSESSSSARGVVPLRARRVDGVESSAPLRQSHRRLPQRTARSLSEFPRCVVTHGTWQAAVDHVMEGEAERERPDTH